MKIDFNDCSILSENFTKHICVSVLKYFIELEEQIIKYNKKNANVMKSSKKALKHLRDSKVYIESYYKK
jgi:hypothetical protein